MSDLNTEESTEATEATEGGWPEWMAQLPTEYKKDEYGKGYKTMGEFYKTHKGLRAKVDGMPQPPAKASEYEFPAPAEDSGVEVNPEVDKWFRKTAFGLKMSKETASKLYEAYNGMVAGLVKEKGKQDAASLKTNDELMHGEWGDDFDTNMKYVDKAIEDLGGKDLQELLDNTGLKNNPVILKALRQVGFEHGEDTIKEGVVTSSTKAWSVEDEYETMKDLPPDRK